MVLKAVVVWNVFLSSEYRINRLIDSMNSLIVNGFIDHSLRIRGPLLQDATYFLNEAGIFDSAKIALHVEQQSKNWKISTLIQVLESDSKLFLLAQEDHICVGSKNSIQDFVNDFFDLGSEVSPVSFFKTYQKMRVNLTSNQESVLTPEGLFIRLGKNWMKSVDDPRYLVSLVGLYRRETLIDLLLNQSYRLRNFPPHTPFDFEQEPSRNWFLPTQFALPLFEFLRCIDDDAKSPGSSLHSNDLYPMDHKRTNEQNIASQRFEILLWMKKILTKFNLEQRTMTKVLIHLIVIGQRLAYTLIELVSNHAPSEIRIRRNLRRIINAK